jgi:hypothetical protein
MPNKEQIDIVVACFSELVRVIARDEAKEHVMTAREALVYSLSELFVAVPEPSVPAASPPGIEPVADIKGSEVLPSTADDPPVVPLAPELDAEGVVEPRRRRK